MKKEKKMSAEKTTWTAKQKPTITRRPLAEIRNEVGVSQAHLAKAAGLSPAAIANIEAGRYRLQGLTDVNGVNGVAIYMALARLAPPQSPLRREAKEEAAKFIAKAKEVLRQTRVSLEVVLEQIKTLDAVDADLEAKAAQLAEM